ncbi:MAG: hypothetical protein WAQ24_00970 [Candidatus Saccharimonadales bacterium]
MIQSICILGRQPALGLAELESLYGASAVTAISAKAAGLSCSVQEINFARLGGSTRLANVVGELPSTNWNQVEKVLTTYVRSSSFTLPTEGKFHLGLSAYSFNVSAAKLNALGLTLKKIIRSRHDGSVRLIPNNDTELSAAQVIHGNLTKSNGAELLLIAAQDKTYIARTVAIQDIASYTLRDRGRPKRDARVGMLPPKLAQIIVNLATGEVQRHESRDMSQEKITVLDPFCGTGVVLQEAILMGYGAYGTDLEPRMIEYTNENLQWLFKSYNLAPTIYNLEIADATSHKWQNSKFQIPNSKVVVACETYLGRPFTERPSSAVLAQTISEVNLILKKFIQNIQPQLPQDTRLCLAVPCWFDGREQKHLPLIQSLSELGFERIQFEHAQNSELIYHRESQIVGRELLVLTRK